MRRRNPTTDPSTLPVGDLPGWRQVFTEDFLRAAALGTFLSTYSAKWGAYNQGESPTYTDTSGHGVYSPARTLSVHDSCLDVWMHTESGVHYVAAPYPKVLGQPSASANGQQYGRYAVRWRCDSAHGYKLVPLLWPDSGSMSLDGEFDNPESNCDGSVSAFLHLPGGGQVSRNTATPAAGAWHTSVTEWTAGLCRFFLDGVQLGADITTNVPTAPFHWVLQCETSTDGTIPLDAVETHVLFDWVAVYAAV